MDNDKDKDYRSTNSIIFSGRKVDEWFKFDRQILRWVRKTYGDSGVKLWSETAIAIDASSVDSIAQDTYESIADSEGFKDADRYWEWDHFWSVRYQQIWRNKTLAGIRDYVEGRTSHRAFQHMMELTADELPSLRSGLQTKFAKATPTVIRSMEQEYEAGMPDSPGKPVFPKGIDIEVKVEQLEDRKRTLWFLCPEGIRKDYVYGQEPKLVRIVLNHLSSDYRHDVNRMLDIHKVQLQLQGSKVPEGTEIEGYSDEWLPTWKTLRATLLKTAEAMSNDSSSSSSTLPTMFTTSNSNSNSAKHGKGGRQCYACGEWGHIRGDPECNAKVGDTHACAPSGSTGRGRGRGNSNRGNGRGRGKGGRGQGICFHFANHGSCRHGQACKWKHEKGNSKGNGANATVVESVMATIRSRLQSQIAKKQNDRKKKGKGKKRSRHSSDEEDSDSNSEDEDAHDTLLSFLTTATKSNRKGKGKGKKERLGMTVIVDSNSCRDSSSHASESEAVVSFSRPLRGGFVGDTNVNHPMVNTHGLENATVDDTLEVSVLDTSTVNRSHWYSSGRLMGLVETNVSAAKEAATKGSKDGGSVKVMAELHSKGVSGWDTDASRAVTTNAQYMIPSLLDRSESATQSISFSSMP